MKPYDSCDTTVQDSLTLFTRCCVEAMEKGASDLHITVETPPVIRRGGDLVRLDYPVLKPKDTEAILVSICPGDRLETFWTTGQIDFSYSIPGTGRFRVNAFKQRGSIAITLRVLSPKVPTFKDLKLPEIVTKIASLRYGLCLITGSTGSGKSSTLAAIIDDINSRMAFHLITLEDPVEFLHKHKKSLVHQREVGSDTPSFADGVRAALREDPNVIVLGELRDAETAFNALRASETGHLVLGTMHAARAPQAITRLVDIFPLEYHRQVRAQISDVLQVIVAQQLVAREGGGRVAICDVLLTNPKVRSAIREDRVEELYEIMEASEDIGMSTMEKCLDNLFEKGVISRPEYEKRRLLTR
jgi:twitching motility protein PilT